MKEIIIQEDVALIESRLKEFESKTGCELLLIVAKSSDSYPAASLRFGILSGFILTFIFSLFFEFNHGYYWPFIMLVFTLLMIVVGNFSWAKKIALNDKEVDRECSEKAIELFHTLGTAKVQHKVTAMIMASILERKITVLVDEKLKEEITQLELDELVETMKIHFKKGNMGLGFLKSIEELEGKILKDFAGPVSSAHYSELADRIYFI